MGEGGCKGIAGHRRVKELRSLSESLGKEGLSAMLPLPPRETRGGSGIPLESLAKEGAAPGIAEKL